jgi:hypothetical protein
LGNGHDPVIAESFPLSGVGDYHTIIADNRPPVKDLLYIAYDQVTHAIPWSTDNRPSTEKEEDDAVPE